MTPSNARRRQLAWLLAFSLIVIVFWAAYWLAISRPATYGFVRLAVSEPRRVPRFFFYTEGKSAMEYPSGLVYKFRLSYQDLSATVKNELAQRGWSVDSETGVATMLSGPWRESVQDSPTVVVRPSPDGNGSEAFVYEPPTWLGSQIEHMQGRDRSVAATAGN